MMTRALAAILAQALSVELTAQNAHADKVWSAGNSTVVIQSTVMSGYPTQDSCTFQTSMLPDDKDVATFGFSVLQAAPLSPFSYCDKAAQWSNNELIQVQVDGNKPIINQAHIDDSRGLSGLLIIPSSHLADQMLHGHTLIVSTRAGVRAFSIPIDAVKAFQECVRAITKRS